MPNKLHRTPLVEPCDGIVSKRATQHRRKPLKHVKLRDNASTTLKHNTRFARREYSLPHNKLGLRSMNTVSLGRSERELKLKPKAKPLIACPTFGRNHAGSNGIDNRFDHPLTRREIQQIKTSLLRGNQAVFDAVSRIADMGDELVETMERRVQTVTPPHSPRFPAATTRSPDIDAEEKKDDNGENKSFDPVGDADDDNKRHQIRIFQELLEFLDSQDFRDLSTSQRSEQLRAINNEHNLGLRRAGSAAVKRELEKRLQPHA